MHSSKHAGGHVARPRITRLDHVLYGADYNPEQWPKEIWPQDALLMRQAGVNLVSLGIFAWARLEPADGRFEFEWLDHVIDVLTEQGVSVDLATPTASPPVWLGRKHPEMLPLDIDGVTLWHGSRRHYCPHSAAYREHATRLVRALAERYADHPAVVMWHIDNEYACHIGECYCDASVAAFRAWLEARYGTVDHLNEAWATSFWSQHYSEWAEVQPPRRTPTFANPGQRLDWQRFCSDSWLDCFEDQAAILRAASAGLLLTTNFMGFHKALDYWRWAAAEDVVSNDCYPETSQPEWHVETAMICDLMRSLRLDRPWMVMEQAAAHVNWRRRNTTKAPGVMRLGSLQALARGAEGVLFFQWRASAAGAEQFHSAMVGHGGAVGRVWDEVCALGAEMARMDELLGSAVHASVGILLDWESWWALEGEGRPSADVLLMEQVRGLYTALHGAHVSVDFAHPGADLSGYRLLVAPCLYLVDAAVIDNLRSWVQQGGTLLLTFQSGIVDATSRVHLGGYPAPFRDVLGLTVEEFAPYAEGHGNQVRTSDGRQFGTSLWSDVVRLEGAEPLATYDRDFFAGSAAVTRHEFGAGTSFYLGSQLDGEGQSWIIDTACAAAGVRVDRGNPADVEMVTRRADGKAWTFVLNHSTGPVSVVIEGPGVDVLTGRAVGRSLDLVPRGAAIVREA